MSEDFAEEELTCDAHNVPSRYLCRRVEDVARKDKYLKVRPLNSKGKERVSDKLKNKTQAP